MYPIHAFGSEAQKECWLPKLAAGEGAGGFDLTEPGFGSDSAGVATEAARMGAELTLNGTTLWITNGSMRWPWSGRSWTA